VYLRVFLERNMAPLKLPSASASKQELAILEAFAKDQRWRVSKGIMEMRTLLREQGVDRTASAQDYVVGCEPSHASYRLLPPSRDVTVFTGSWTVGNASPSEVDLSSWIPRNQYDVYVIGVQECMYEAARDMCDKEVFPSCSAEWLTQLQMTIGNEYQVITSVSLREIRITAFVRKSLASGLSGVYSDNVATGIGNVVGNKGGVAITFSMGHQSFCFLNCHLAAHQHKQEDRNDDIRLILQDLALRTPLGVCESYDVVFIMGDLNYRLDFGPETEVRPCVCVCVWGGVGVHVLHCLCVAAVLRAVEEEVAGDGQLQCTGH
jgi:hypothetical protein